jgi:hypothetical protein
MSHSININFYGLELEVDYAPPVRATRMDPPEPLEVEHIEIIDVVDGFTADDAFGLELPDDLFEDGQDDNLRHAILDEVDPRDLYDSVAEYLIDNAELFEE